MSFVTVLTMNTFTFWYKTCDGTHTFQSHLEFLVCETHNHGSLFACVSIKVSVFLPLFLFLFFFSNFLGAKSRNNTFDLKKFFVYPLYIHSFWLHDIFSKFGTCLFTHFMISSDASVQFSSVFSHVRLFATPWTTARQASQAITNSRSPPTTMSIESMMPSHSLLSPSPPASLH